jgi:hypothetical protein
MQCARKFANVVLGDTVLVVSIHPTEGKLLVCLEARFAEFIVVESSVVTMVMLNGDAMFAEMLLAVHLGFQCLLGVHLHLAIDKILARELVDEYCGTRVLGMLELAFELRY